jgi:hypothetical protein
MRQQSGPPDGVCATSTPFPGGVPQHVSLETSSKKGDHHRLVLAMRGRTNHGYCTMTQCLAEKVE